jgi:hypothetical protein
MYHNATNTYKRLFWNLLTTEFKHKYEFLVGDYLKNILDIYDLSHSDINLPHSDINLPHSDINLKYLINKLRSIPKFSSKFYINTTAIYKNNLQNIIKDIDKIKKKFKENKTNKNLRYFKIDPNLEKVITKKRIIFKNEGTKKTFSITIEIINLIIEPKVEGNPSAELLLNQHDYDNNENKNKINDIFNVKLNKKDKKAPQNFFRIPHENIKNIIGYKISDTIHEVINSNDFNFLRNNYIIEDSYLNRRIKYQLINKTLNYPELEIIIFCDDSMETQETNLTYLGEVHGPPDPNLRNRPEYYTFIYLLTIDNTIGNLFELLDIDDILNDLLTTRSIINKILIQFRSMYVMYYNFDIVDDVIINEIFKNNFSFFKKIMSNLNNLNLSIDDNLKNLIIETYLNVIEPTIIIDDNLKNLIIETYLNVIEPTIIINEDNDAEEEEEEEEEEKEEEKKEHGDAEEKGGEEEQKSMSNGKKNINNKTKRRRK